MDKEWRRCNKVYGIDCKTYNERLPYNHLLNFSWIHVRHLEFIIIRSIDNKDCKHEDNNVNLVYKDACLKMQFELGYCL